MAETPDAAGLPGVVPSPGIDPSMFELDDELRRFAWKDDQLGRTLGAGLKRLFELGLMPLGYHRRADYVREMLGFGVRHAQELVQTETLIVSYPETERLWNQGRISRCHVRELLRRVPAEDEFAWARLATIMRVRQLVDRLEVCGFKPRAGRNTLEDKPPEGRFLEFQATPDLRQKLAWCQEIVNRLSGDDDGGETRLIEALLDEFSSSVPLDVYRQLDAEGGVDPPHDYRDDLDRMRAENERTCARRAQNWSHLSWEVPQVALPDFRVRETDDAHAIDRRLQDAVRYGQEQEGLLMRKLWEARRVGLSTALGFESLEHYARERLGMSGSRLHTLLRVYRGLRQFPRVRDSYVGGDLSLSKANEVLRIATRGTVDAWVTYARHLTVRKLRTVVKQAVSKQQETSVLDVYPPDPTVSLHPKTVAALADELARLGLAPGAADGSGGLPSCAHPGGADRAGEPGYSGELPTCAHEMAPGADDGSGELPTCAHPGADPGATGNSGDLLTCAHDMAAGSTSPADAPGELPTCAPDPKVQLPPAAQTLSDMLARSGPPNGLRLEAIGERMVARLMLPIVSAGGRPVVRAAEATAPQPSETPVRMRVWLPADLELFWQEQLALCRLWLGGDPTIGQCIERMVLEFMGVYQELALAAAREHKVIEAGGWLCSTPGCTAKAGLEAHHLIFRSQGGGDELSNQSPTCAPHHHHGIHEGRMRARGVSPDGIVWALGIQEDGRASQVLVGDLVVYSKP